ncbi:MAG: HPr family phosphocarrier protein [Spirochaetales bacterium]|nr:HPr family phosphocarrier protein [Spirochaetales bacterium]
MISRKVTVRNKAGIHVRPSTIILEAAQKYSADIKLRAKGIEAELSGPAAALSLLAMGLKHGDSAELQVSGPNEKKVCENMAGLLEKVYDFPPRT